MEQKIQKQKPMIISAQEINDLADHITMTFRLSNIQVRACLFDYFSEAQSERAENKRFKDESNEIDREQDDLTNSQM